MKIRIPYVKDLTYHKIRHTQDLCQANIHFQKVVPVQQINLSVNSQ